MSKPICFAGTCLAAGLCATSAQAGLIGDDVTLTSTAGWINAGGTATVDANVEFSGSFEVDVRDDGFDVVLTSGPNIGGNAHWFDLTSLDRGQPIAGLDITLGTVPGNFDTSDFTFTADSVRVVVGGNAWSVGNSFSVDFTPPIPEPSSLALLGLGGSFMLRRRR